MNQRLVEAIAERRSGRLIVSVLTGFLALTIVGITALPSAQAASPRNREANRSDAVTITKVRFSGDTATLRITVIGSGFASEPKAYNDDDTSCGMYTNNGYAFGKHLYLTDVNNFTAGYGIPPGASCVGIVVTTWSNTKIVFGFGESYDTFDHWYISNGDQYQIGIKGVETSGTVTFK
jgi:hypothetical protein